eukprot:scaffold50136_cov64-Phaeocystis_antarctica.AAC.7
MAACVAHAVTVRQRHAAHGERRRHVHELRSFRSDASSTSRLWVATSLRLKWLLGADGHQTAPRAGRSPPRYLH